jgi:hypothetical protein
VLGLPAKQWILGPFLPLVFTLAMQILALKIGDNVASRIRSELSSNGVPTGTPTEVALRGAKSFGLIGAIYSGLTSLLGVSAISLIGVKVSYTILLSGAFLGVFGISFTLIGLALTTSPIDIYEEFSADDLAHPLPLHEKLLYRLGITIDLQIRNRGRFRAIQ